ncbi:MAG: S24/S26 family peptidase [Bacteroidia bacterium]|nr:S24/S26 family peptidase [Bacteroidia bacterium]
MDSFSPRITGSDNSFDRDAGIITAVLESGNSVELPATGYSMFPTFSPGDKVVVKPLGKEELPLPGMVVVCMDKGATAQMHNNITTERHNGILVMHRLIEIIGCGSGNVQLITRGDSRMEPDEPWPIGQLMGVAVSYRAGKKVRLVKIYVPCKWRYGFNSRILWLYNRVTKGLKDKKLTGSR